MVVQGSEWLSDVSVVTDPVGGVWYDSYPVNPAEPWTFPRISNIAKQYQKYTCSSVNLVYTPTCPTTQKGTIYLAPLRNPTDEVPATPQLISGLSGCVRSAVRDRCSVAFSRAQLSQALNGFYCGTADGISPADDDITKTCGRFAIMLDGVAKTDGVIGTIQIQYLFTLSDPKIVPEGSSIHGTLTSPTFASSVDLDDATLVGTPAVVPYESGRLRKRTTTPVLLFLRYVNTGTAVPFINMDDSVTVTPTLHHKIDVSDNCVAMFRLPAGRHVLELDSDGDSWTNLEIESWSVAAV